VRKLLGLRNVAHQRRALEKRICPEGVFAAFIDFEYHHYALGDLLTKLVEIGCAAVNADCSAVDLYIGVDEHRPAAPKQGFILPENYTFHLEALVPAMLCQPMLRSLHFLRDGGLSLNFIRRAAHKSGSPMWPSYSEQINRSVHYPYGHASINQHYRQYGTLPSLNAPKGYEAWVDAFIRDRLQGKFIVAVNTRQSRLTQTPATTYRDADLSVWNAFFSRVHEVYPEVQFLRVGGFSELDNESFRHGNVTAIRQLGLDLSHELALLTKSNMFMGTSSGFGAMATFTDIPYLICNVEKCFAGAAEVKVGDPYPFALEGQTLLWREEDADFLFAYLEREVERSKREQLTIAG
jgi:hypothetical protein